jgi:hypothetical protein
MNGIDKAREMINASSNKIKAMVEKALSHKKSAQDVFDEKVRELRADVKEVEVMTGNPAYLRYNRFMDGIRNGFSSALERIAAKGENVLEMARLGARIEVIDQIRNEPNRLIEELKRVEKLANEK